MAVAEKQTVVQTTPRSSRQIFMVHSALGAFYLLASLWLVFMGLPTFWRIIDLAGHSNEFLADSLLFLVVLPTILGLFVLGKMLEGPNPVPGLRSGAFYLSFCVIVFGLLITCGSRGCWSGSLNVKPTDGFTPSPSSPIKVCGFGGQPSSASWCWWFAAYSR
jgi:hypothetical protein